MAYGRDRNVREVYEERCFPERAGPSGGGGVERRGFSRPEEDFNRLFDYDGGPRGFYPGGGGAGGGGGGPRGYHGEDQRGYHHGDNLHFPNDRRGAPPSRREEPYPYRGPRDDPPLPAWQMEFRSSSSRAPPPPSVRGQRLYAGPRPLSAQVPEGDDTLMQAILNMDRGEDRDSHRRKAPFPPPIRERSPLRRDVPPSPHSRSGSSVSSRGYTPPPDRSKALLYPPQPAKNKDRPPGHSVSVSGDGSPQAAILSAKEEAVLLELEREEGPPGPPRPEDAHKAMDDLASLHERRAQAISNKAMEIETVYRQDCETFGMVVKMLGAKDPGLEKQLQTPLRENLGKIRRRCLDDLKQFITELDEVVRQPEPSA